MEQQGTIGQLLDALEALPWDDLATAKPVIDRVLKYAADQMPEAITYFDQATQKVRREAPLTSAFLTMLIAAGEAVDAFGLYNSAIITGMVVFLGRVLDRVIIIPATPSSP